MIRGLLYRFPRTPALLQFNWAPQSSSPFYKLQLRYSSTTEESPEQKSESDANKKSKVQIPEDVHDILKRSTLISARKLRKLDFEWFAEEESIDSESTKQEAEGAEWKKRRDKLKAKGIDQWKPKHRLPPAFMEGLRYLYFRVCLH